MKPELEREIQLQYENNTPANATSDSVVIFHFSRDLAVYDVPKLTGIRNLIGRIDSLSIDETSACRRSTKIPPR